MTLVSNVFCIGVPYSKSFWTTCTSDGVINVRRGDGNRSRAHIVAEHTLYQMQGVVGHDLVKDHLLVFFARRLKLLLNEARPVLIAAELDNVAEDILQLLLGIKA